MENSLTPPELCKGTQKDSIIIGHNYLHSAANVLLLHAGLDLKTSDLKLITWTKDAGISVALITCRFVSDGIERADMRMLAQGHCDDIGQGSAQVIYEAIAAMLLETQDRVADFATLLEECEDNHMNVHIPANCGHDLVKDVSYASICRIFAPADKHYRIELETGMCFWCAVCLSSRRDYPSWTRTGHWSFISTTWRSTWSLDGGIGLRPVDLGSCKNEMARLARTSMN